MTYEQDLRRVLELIDNEYGDFGYSTLARAAGLHPSTVYRVFYHETKYPLYRTVWKLAKAVGMTVHLKKIQLKLKKAS